MKKLLKRVIDPFAGWWMRHRSRWGDEPGWDDVSTKQMGIPFQARPKYKYYKQRKRPCYMPVYHRPQLPTKEEEGQAITEGWPCEGYRWHNQRAGPHCWAPKGFVQDGDWIQVIRQVRGQVIRNERLEESDVWDVVLVPLEYARVEWAKKHDCRFVHWRGDDYYLGFTPDIWMGNTGWRDIPYDPTAEL